ncbi:FAD-binding oxidoreductase [Amycolatopsis sp.]|uniref:FAD-binding oxidoreductase n=1 Tax=Amycolatopsis sp. TaxID=37632 RepID=UPI002C7C054F|nr:FAD-binding oxidoreductase [Amycolatopsis sp.]HVV11934.1 FAD-binding oxidoreductase [Amycolatopsis sp.]
MTTVEAQALPRFRVTVPEVVTPTLLLFGGSLGLGASAVWLALGEHFPAWVTVPMHVVAMFGLFVVVHESSHHAAGRLTWINDVLGRVAILFTSAFVSFPAARFLHLEQHRAGGQAHLTPWNLRGPRWQLPLRWMATDLWHAFAYFQRTANRPQAEVAESLAMLVLLPGTLAAVTGTGHGLELLIVYLLPQRLTMLLGGWWFDWFPRHHSPDARSYRSVHSRYPSLPFYRYLQGWRADREPWCAPPPAPARRGEFHRLTVTSVRRPLDRVALVGFTVPPELRNEFRFTPGQHVTLRAVVDGEVLRRKYAVLARPGEDELHVAIKQLPGGRFSGYATSALAPGDELDVLPPEGEFTLCPESRDTKHFVAIAAGIGIAPVLPVLGHALATATRCRATLLYVNRSGADTLFAEELSKLTRRFEGRLRVVHFRTDERDPELRPARTAKPFDSIGSALAISDERYQPGAFDGARLRALLAARLHPAKVDEWLLCVPPALADSVRAVLAEHHVPPDAIHGETFHVVQPA